MSFQLIGRNDYETELLELGLRACVAITSENYVKDEDLLARRFSGERWI